MRLKNIPVSEWPIWIGAAILFVGSALLIAQILLGALAQGKQMKLSAMLIGMQTAPEAVPLSITTVVSGVYQAGLARRIGSRQPYYPSAVRIRNQLEFSAFGVSPIPGVINGKGGQLLETGYVTDYCSRDLAAFSPSAAAWAAKIRQMQDSATAQGKIFLYIITPSKVAQYPDELPAGMPCRARPADQAGLLPVWAAMVRQAGVHMVNTAAILSAAHGAYPFRLFPSGGTHWNQVGSALAAQAIVARLQVLRPGPALSPMTFAWKASAHPDSTDSDLLALLNLFWSPAVTDAPDVTVRQPFAAPNCHKPRVVIIGGSFMQSIGSTLASLPCGASVVEYFYWKIGRVTWDANGRFTMVPVVPAVRDRDLRDADILLYEENESLIGHSNHGEAYYQWLRDRPSAGR